SCKHGKTRRRWRRKLIRTDLAPGEDIFRHGDRRRGVRPAGIEREVRDDLGDLARLHAVVERQVEVVRHLDRLVACDQRGERNDAAVARAEATPCRYVAEKTFLRVLLKGRRYGPNIARRAHWSDLRLSRR